MTTDLALSDSTIPSFGGGSKPPAERPNHRRSAPHLTRRQKAAVVVRLLMAEGAELPLGDLPESLQADLTTQMSQMHYINRATLRAVIEEFANELDSIGLAFPGGLEGALSILEGVISPDIAARLREQAGMVWLKDPWDSLSGFPIDKLLPLLKGQSPEVGAVLLSKLKVARAAELLGRLPGDQARRLTFAMSETASVNPDTVRRIGLSLAAEMKAEPPRAFAIGAVARVGAILNVSPSATREDVLAGLDEDDAEFAEEVRRAIFTFPDIPTRIRDLDVTTVLRKVEQPTLVTIIAGVDARSEAAVDFLLENMSKRLAATLRDEAGERKAAGALRVKDVEAAQAALVEGIRDLIDSGEIQMARPEDD